jgi:uncharacterized membrane protein (DUF4010 family)
MDAIDLDLLERLAVALGIGLLIGLERGWKRRLDAEGSRVAGFRTNGLAGLLGGIFGVFAEEGGVLAFAVAFLAFAGVMALFYWREGENEAERDEGVSATSALANLCAFALGGLAGAGALQPAAALAVVVALLLAFKDTLHGFLRRFTFEELRAVLGLLAMTAVALPLLPDQRIGPWNAINPREVWILTILIAAISSAGYVASKLIGPRWGPLASAALGALVSSTAVTFAHARLARRHPEMRSVLLAGILLAASVMFVRVWALGAILRPDVAPHLALASAAAVLVFLASAGLALRGQFRAEMPAELPIKKPFELPTVLLFGGLLALASVLAAGFEAAFGSRGLFLSSAIAGFADVDAAAISVLRLESNVAAATAATAILVAAAADSVFKVVAAWWIGGRALGFPFAVATAAALAAASVALVL